MTLQLNEKFINPFVSQEEITQLKPEIDRAVSSLKNKSGLGNDFLGWVDLPVDYDKDEFDRILKAAERIKKQSDILIVIGIGGSYLGARAAIEFINSPLYNQKKKDTPDIYYAGNNMSTAALSDLLSICEGKDISINVISKSGTTTEPAIAFRAFRELLIKKYGVNGARERIFVTADRARGNLKAFADESGFETFVIPDDVGGRFSVLTAVGLLPIACAGINISEMMNGAADAREKFLNADLNENTALRYAAYRNLLYRNGKQVEILVGYENHQLMLNEWWKQLYGESEGKEGKGIFPASCIFSTDLHSLGQYIQEGSRIIFETVLDIRNTGAEYIVPYDNDNVDGLNFLSGKSLSDINKTAMIGTLIAHTDGLVPNLVIELQDRSAYSFGYLIYFFEYACAVSGYLLKVNPFNQPGVEAYKKNMFALLGKPGYEEAGELLKKRL